jgi:thiol:disulfide interchange protein DsbD
MLTRALLLSLALASITAHAAPSLAASNVVTTPQVRAELVAHAPDGIAAGKTVWLGLKLTHQPHWHT